MAKVTRNPSLGLNDSGTRIIFQKVPPAFLERKLKEQETRRAQIKNEKDKLFEAYRETDYVVKDTGVELVIRVGDKNSDLDNLFAATNVNAGAFLTAYNPFSKELSRTENESRQKELIKFLNEEGYKFFYGYGEDETGEWQPEPSLLILGIDFQKALKLARKFEQNAFVFLKKEKVPKLIKSL